MVVHPFDRRVVVSPFEYRIDGDEAIIANAHRSSFLAIPVPALDLLDDLAKGKTTGEAQEAYARKYGETPDLEDFLDLLAAEGFISHPVADISGAPVDRSADEVGAHPPDRRYHFQQISERTARRLCSGPVLLACGAIIFLALVAIAREPSLLPAPEVMVFQHDLTLLTLAMTVFIFATIFLHELAHLVAARAAGVPARLGLSNRLWYLVAETDLTGVWLATRAQRYLAFLAGPLLDATSGAILVLLLWAQRAGLWLSPLELLLCQVFLFTYIVRLLWQCYFFVRTDFYYVIAAAFNCKNLLGDTEIWLRNQVARVLPGVPVVDQSAIPVHERRVIRAYAIVWLLGRGIALFTLLWFSLPILWGYGRLLLATFLGDRSSPYALVDVLVWSGLALAVQGSGLFLWLRGLYRSFSPGE